MAAGARIELIFDGHAGHAALPHLTRDPLLAASREMSLRFGRDQTMPPALFAWTAPLFEDETPLALALREAAAVIGEWRLTGCTVVVTLEPCPMCAGAAAMSRVARVVFGAWNSEYGAAGSHWDLLRDRRMAHRPEVVSGVLEDECGRLVLDFMSERREEKA
jgi:pyrimidine deaminase RibD-like protein